jgi:hypothetical protein
VGVVRNNSAKPSSWSQSWLASCFGPIARVAEGRLGRERGIGLRNNIISPILRYAKSTIDVETTTIEGGGVEDVEVVKGGVDGDVSFDPHSPPRGATFVLTSELRKMLSPPSTMFENPNGFLFFHFFFLSDESTPAATDLRFFF